ncbi:DUF4019 domain-containing protein [Xylella taiwanensis]|uniref:DUF4019 domain-containing protein n=2 Tax=Xylella taiwanensis TaxID=1444770 RepID=A0ABS8TQA2_9GAMM|nr:DUF4019 domain-containing protein [Xylella taiwanensis]AXI84288.1 hypothetical protein AB672_10255 [Xylella taiwanensis]MCD8457403.1 DUF4019 domain-containing protein [Xylella taiwanensis]MCD8457561.1 DUF4019 domain-containing protein [Xylella taiwanensis]MCD8461315.1 DUF4019 domain-containing protein [Xylella taiwanensis]MCD8462651.1 DUF4019 domain-containing protein [Xylella taiwanensis]
MPALNSLKLTKLVLFTRIRSMFCPARLLVLVFLAPLLGRAQSQVKLVAVAPTLTPAQQVQLARQNAMMNQAALKVAQLVDAGQIAQIWDGASVVAKQAVRRDAFIEQIGVERGRLGTVIARTHGVVTRVQYGTGMQVPAGLYFNVSFTVRFANASQPLRELISFRQDDDNIWRLSGYSLRAPGNEAAF